MGQFLPIRAISRSQAVRIGGQTIKTNATSYVDFGNLAPLLAAPTLDVTKITGKVSEQHAGSRTLSAGKEGGLKASVFFGYAVTAVDANGVETPINGIVVGETGAGNEEESKMNFITVKWYAAPNAISYNVYRYGTSAAGIASEVLALAGIAAGKLYFLANVLPATNTTLETYQDTGVEVTTKVPPVVNNTNIYPSRAFSPQKELRNHLAIGSVIVAGGLTNSNSDWVVPDTPSTVQFVLTFEAEKIKVAEGFIDQRSTGTHVIVAETSPTTKKAEAASEIRSYVVFNTLTHLTEVVEGVEAATAKAVLPTLTSVQVPLYSIYVKAGKNNALLYDLRPRA